MHSMVMTSVAAGAAPKAKARVYVNSYMKPNYAIVSVDATENNAISELEVTDESGRMVYVTKKTAPVKAAQYLLDIAKLKDGVYNVNFSFKKGESASKTFVIRDNKVVR